VRERTCRAVRAEQRNANRFAGAFLDSLRAGIVVGVRLGEARRDGVDLDPGRLQLDGHGERHSVESRSNDLEKGTSADENQPEPVADCHATPLSLASAILAA
jgi:hypothetical protein